MAIFRNISTVAIPQARDLTDTRVIKRDLCRKTNTDLRTFPYESYHGISGMKYYTGTSLSVLHLARETVLLKLQLRKYATSTSRSALPHWLDIYHPTWGW